MVTTPKTLKKGLEGVEGTASVSRKRSKKIRKKALRILQDPDVDDEDMLCTRSTQNKVVNALQKNAGKVNIIPRASSRKKRVSKAAVAVVSPMNPQKSKTLMGNVKLVYKNPYSGEDNTRKKVKKIPADLKVKLFQDEITQRRLELQSSNRPLTLAERAFLIETEVDQEKLEILHQDDFFDLTQQSVPESDSTSSELMPEKSASANNSLVADKLVISIPSSPATMSKETVTDNLSSDGVMLIHELSSGSKTNIPTLRSPVHDAAYNSQRHLSIEDLSSSPIVIQDFNGIQNVATDDGSSLIVNYACDEHLDDLTANPPSDIRTGIDTGSVIDNSQISRVSQSEEEWESAIDESDSEQTSRSHLTSIPENEIEVSPDNQDPHLKLMRDITQQIMGNTLAREWWSRILSYDPLPINEFTKFLRETLGMAAVDKRFVQEWADFAGVTLKNDDEKKRGKQKRVKSKSKTL